jgi:PAS domain S-box-containing protein
MNSLVSTQTASQMSARISSEAILDALPVAAYACDAHGFIIRYNQRAKELWGREPRLGEFTEQFCGSHQLCRPDGAFLPSAESPMATALRTGEFPNDQEVIIERPSGDRIVVLLSINPLRDEFGGLVGAVGCFVDVTERRKVDDQLCTSQRDLEDFFENGAVALHWVGPDGRILRANQAELDLLGYERDEYIGRHISEFHADAPIIDDILLRLSRCQKLERIPARLRTKSGGIRHVLISSNVYVRDGNFVHTRCFTIDVTERCIAEADLKESERRWRELLAALPLAVYTTDEHGAITFYNEAAAELWGVRPELGTSYWCGSWRLLWPDGTPVPHDQCPMAIALKEGRIVRNVEAIAERPDGTRIPFMPYPTPMRDAENRLVGAVNMLIDLTHLKDAHRRQQLLINELNHRVKNTLATVQSIAYQTFGGKVDRALHQQFDTRLISLAKTHDMLTREKWRGADLRELITQSVAFACHVQDRATIDGPTLFLPQRTVVPLAMAVHELCTNASKYGALTQPQGRITIDWRVFEDGARLVLRWVESGGPAVKPPAARGFGTRLLERGLAHELRASVKLTFPSSGVVCEIDLPLDPGIATI